MKHRSDVQRDAVMQSASVGKHLDRAIGTGCLVDSDEAVIKWDIMGDEILLFECSAPCGDDLASFATPTGPTTEGSDDEGSEPVTAGDVASKRQAMMSKMPLNVGVQRCFMWKLVETRTCNGCHATS